MGEGRREPWMKEEDLKVLRSLNIKIGKLESVTRIEVSILGEGSFSEIWLVHGMEYAWNGIQFGNIEKDIEGGIYDGCM